MSTQVPYSPLRRRDPSISGDEDLQRPPRSRSASRTRTRSRGASSSRTTSASVTPLHDDFSSEELELRRLPRTPHSARVEDVAEKTDSEAETDSEAGDLEALLQDPETEESKHNAALEEDLTSEDPVAVVRRTIPETDDPTLPALTLRVFLIGSVFACVGGGLSQLFFYKSNSPSFSSYFVILVTLPLGRWLARITPKRSVYLPWLGEVPLNPGPFNIKEHLLIAVISSCGTTSAYASDILNIQDLFYHQRMSILSSMTLLLTTQTLGFGFAGLVQGILVKPIAMIFPGTLVSCTMFHTLHAAPNADTRPRLKFFMFAFIAIFIYQMLPALIMPSLTSVALLCLLNNKNSAFRVLSSGMKGFGIANLSFDWSAIGASGPLYTPWWASVNFFSGIGGAMWIVMPALYFADWWQAKSFNSPVGAGMYESKGFTKFNVTAVLDANNELDPVKWDAAKPILLTPWFALSYGVCFAILTSMLSHVLLWHRADIMAAVQNRQLDDYHNRAMRAYQPVPMSWFLITLAASLGAAVVLVATSPLQLPVWGLLLAVAISLTFLIPVGLIKAVSNTSIGLNVLTEFVAGIVIQGKPIGNVAFKCYGYMAMSQALDLTADLKLAHYMKIPPRSMFVSQMVGTVIGCMVNLAVVRFVLNPDAGYRDFLTGVKVDPTAQWDGRKLNIFYSASIIWGAIGPLQFFSGKYSILYWGFLVGAVLPVIPWLLYKRFPKQKWLKLINFPVLLHGASIPPQIPNNIILSGLIVAYISQCWARKKYPRWHAKRNFILSAALDAGTSVNALAIFVLSVTLLKIIPVPRWWGNPVSDAEHCTP